MKLLVLSVGSPRDRHLASAIRGFEARAGRYFRLETIEVPAATAAAGNEALARAREADAIGRRLPSGLETWALTRRGEALDSRGLASALSEIATYGRPGVAFLIGGAFGLDPDLLRRCRRRISLSLFTLPHDLARLVLVEQIYRAGTLMRGEPYHKGK